MLLCFCTHHEVQESLRVVAQATVVSEPITAEGRRQGAAEEEEQAGPAEHDEDNDEDDDDGGGDGCRLSSAVCLCLQHNAVHFYSRQERENRSE